MIDARCRIIFIGTPLFAATTLQAILDNGGNIVAVITAPDKQAGRGMQLQQSDVKKLAIQNNIPVLQPEKLKNTEFLELLKSYNAHLQIVVAFRMLPEAVWSMPSMGTINLHASLLPNYRGAAPINWAIINGETQTGITTFKLQHAIDTGNILLQETVQISPTMNVGELHDTLMNNGAQLIVKTIVELLNKTVSEKPQSLDNNAKHAPKIYSETCKIDWNLTAENVYNLIRGMSPYPAAFTMLQNKKLKIYAATFTTQMIETATIGQYKTDGKSYLHFVANNGVVNVLDVQLEGKKRMLITDFLRGVKL
jgi:methionyl-tRNA formyltransferase